MPERKFDRAIHQPHALSNSFAFCLMTASGTDNLLNKAVEQHKMGDLGGAIRSYEKFLKKNPRHPGALHLLGLTYFQDGKAAKAVSILERAIALRPDLPGASYNLGTVLQAMKRYKDAVPPFERALAANPRDFEAHNSLATVLAALGRSAAAVAHFEKAIALRPNYAPAHVNLGNLLLADKNFEQASLHYRSAILHDPKLITAYLGLATALRGLQNLDEAVKVCERAVALAPENAEARHCFGGVLYDAKRFTEGVGQDQKAIALKPDFAGAYFGLAASQYALNRYRVACDNFFRALALGLSVEAANEAEIQLGWGLHMLGREVDADRMFDKIIAEDGDGPRGREAKKLKGMMYLNRGNLADGWPLYEYRRGADPPDAHESRRPRWHGEALTGKLWVWGEQGLGDQILHASMIDDLRSRASSLILEVEPRLVTLFARSFPGIRVLALDTDLPQEDVQAQTSIATLGRFLRPSLQSFPRRERGYLTADPARTVDLRARLAAGGKKVVGVSWRSGNPKTGHSKSAQLIDFSPILELEGIRFVDLQFGDTSEERAQVERATKVAVTKLEEIDNTKDIDGLAALMSACDAVVTISNTNAHLAGALGRPTWVFVPFSFGQIWYWFAGKKDSPWYSRVKVQHQVEGQSWQALISLARAEITSLLALSESEPS
jgi:tetratricopeptide (TPR) repeat protein